MVSLAATTAMPFPPGDRPQMSLKRDSSYMDAGEDEPRSSQSKKLKVAFDPDVEVRVMDDWNEKPMDLIRVEVKNAIDMHLAGDSSAYDQLKQVFTVRPTDGDAPSTTQLRKYIAALMGNVRLLTKRCSSLVNAVLDCSWLGRDEAFLGHYLRFLGSLASAHGGYVEEVLKRLVAYFTDLPASTGHLPNQPVVRRSQLLARVHTTLKYLLRLIPSASARLSNVLPSKFPFPTDTTKAHISYVENLLKLIQYVPELKSEVLALITERLVKIDVQIQVDMDDLEEEMGDKIVQDMQQKTIRNLEDSEASDDSDNESVSSSEDSSTPEEMRMKELRSAVATMDAILDLLFGYYSPIFANGTAWDIDETFEHLLLQFANIVLPTYRSRHTQFLLFHFGQLSPDLIAKFAGACGHLALTKERIPQLVRLSAATYLASFVARGARISSQVVRDVFDLLGSHLDYIRRTEEPTCRGPELGRYSLYYALAQAVLYIFCFRWRDLVVNSADPDYDIDELDDAALFDGRELNWAPGIKERLTQNIYSKLNPLKVCSPSIVQQFARISRHLQFMYIFPLLETNKRLRLSTFPGATSASDGAFGGIARETALTGKLGESYHQLDAYFPFDPYQLPRSKRWLEGDYVQWKGIPGLDDDDKDDDSSDSDESEEDRDEDEPGEEEVDTDTESP